MSSEYPKFRSIPRLSRDMVVTEKIDGTNGLISINEDGIIAAGSRNRWLTLQDDNFGFARWVHENREELLKLGPGLHYGEWWGKGIQRGYGINEKRFSLFNTKRWENDAVRPACCHVVPVLSRGEFYTVTIDYVLHKLYTTGSVAAPGFMQPEGVVIYHTQGNLLFKKTLDGDGHKGVE